MSNLAPRILSVARRAAPALAGLALLVPGGLRAQETGTCRFLEGTESAVTNVVPGAGRITWLSRPRIACSDGVRIEADSAIAYSAQSMSHLMGNVRYHDGARELDADEARYFSNMGRLQATGHLFMRDTLQGSTIENGNLIYLRETDFRPQEEMTVTVGPDRVRPVALLRIGPGPDTASARPAAVPADTAAPPAPPVTAPDSAVVRDTAVAADTTTRADTATVARDTTVAPDITVVADTAVAGERVAAPDTTLAADTVPPGPVAEAPGPPPASPPPDTVPYRVEANRIFLQGDQYFTASGDVVITRDSLQAYGDSAEYDQAGARMDLVGSARVEGSGYDLSGRKVELTMPGGRMRSVRALHQAQLVGEDLHMRAPVIEIFLSDGEMDRLVAVALRPPEATGGAPPAEPDSADLARPVAEARDFVLTADSVDVRTPGQVLDRIFATGDARGESTARDSLNVESLPPVARKDWLEGDTVVATFVRAAPRPGVPADSARQDYNLDSLVAHGAARSLYRLPPSDSTARPGIDPPAVSYVTGSKITIVMNGAEVDRMEVEGPTAGWQLEPTTRGTPADSLAPPDTSHLGPDTAAASGASGEPAPARRPRPAPPSHREGAYVGSRPAPTSTDPQRRRRRRGR